ncbi:DNA helicase [Roseovarius sp. CAU 1744]|uniref:DNA helicase n=1 Tax=Roseovarius sp. CAU 1744 TaxID=3140368 RepID=UPI00325B34CF
MRFSAPIYRLKRQAKAISRKKNVPLNVALDSIARSEGYRSWSQLAAQEKLRSPAEEVLSALAPGEMLLLAARPGHGKTALAIEIAAAAAEQRNAYIYSLDYNRSDIDQQIKSFARPGEPNRDRLVIDTSDGICADYIIEDLKDAPAGSIVVIDYLQILDQQRNHPTLQEQLSTLAGFASGNKLIVILISQIDRQFDLSGRNLPELADVRLPNPVRLSLFDKYCFLHEGQMQLHQAAAP